MNNIELTNEETARDYVSECAIDQWVHVPAREGDGECYRGMISAINPEAAARYVRFGGNLIRKKTFDETTLRAEE